MASGYRHKGKSTQYKHVYITKDPTGKVRYVGNVLKRSKAFAEEKDAAKYVDIVLIENHKPPVNILKPR